MLAEAVLNSLISGGRSDSESRLWLADELGMLDDRRWFGETGLSLSGNTPRHRAIARFAVEDRLKAIVSLNWDTLLEAALDSVGLAEGVTPPRPWRVTARVSAIDDIHMPHLGYANIFPVIKPHGCGRSQSTRNYICGYGLILLLDWILVVTHQGKSLALYISDTIRIFAAERCSCDREDAGCHEFGRKPNRQSACLPHAIFLRT